MKKKQLLWVGLYLALILLPVVTSVLALRAAGWPLRPLWDDGAAALGMAGLAIVLLSFCLLGRAKPLSSLLGSDLLMQAHQLMGRTALVVLLLHPFFYSLWAAPAGPAEPTLSTSLRITGGSWGLFTGLLALACLLALVFTAIFRQRIGLAYERWRWIHSVLALAVLVLGVHHTLVSGRYAQLPAVAGVWALLTLLALASWLVVYALRPLMQRASSFSVSRLTRCADRIWLLEITPQGPHRLPFRAGQFVWLKIGHRWPHIDNPFSISNAPDASGKLQFLIKEAGDMTRALASCPLGTAVYVDGAHGRFDIPADAKAVTMLAGGIGIAPMVSLLADAVARQDPRPIRLLYADKCPSQMVDVLTLSGAANLPDFKLLRMVEHAPDGWGEQVGRLDADGLTRAMRDPAFGSLGNDSCHLICGPDPMMDAVETTLMRDGVPASLIVSKHFKYDFSGRSPLALRVRQGWWLTSGGLVLGLAVMLIWR
ncbi:MAG: ferric reductase-like transmembrane domain-containing protein [Rubrivivax sp.]|nr:ferric reductase-like transmembrane domain-containing protein [Rubrivivax sp.]